MTQVKGYPFEIRDEDQMLQMCGMSSLNKWLHAKTTKVDVPKANVAAFDDADKDYLADMWADFEHNWENLLSGFEYKTPAEMTCFAEKFLYYVKRLNFSEIPAVLDEFLYALQNSKHAVLFEVPNFAEAICDIDLKVAVKYLEKNVKKWTKELYEAILCNMHDVTDLEVFSIRFRNKRAQNNHFISAIYTFIFDGEINDMNRQMISSFLDS